MPSSSGAACRLHPGLFVSAPSAEELLAEARSLAKSGKKAEAADRYEAAAAAAPHDAGVHMSAGGAAFAAGRAKRAVELFERVVRLTPAHGAALINIGAIHNQTGAHKEAERVLLKAITLNHNVPEGFYNLGIARRKMGKNRMAADAYREAIRLDPAFAEAHQNLGNTLLDLGRSKAAADAFREALRIRPDFPKASAGLRRAQGDAAEKHAALHSIDRLVSSLPPAKQDGAKRKQRADRYPPLTRTRRARDRAQLILAMNGVETACDEWSGALRRELPATLLKLEQSMLGSTGARLTEAVEAFDAAVQDYRQGAAAFRMALVTVRAHEELIRAPKLAPLAGRDGKGGGKAEPASDASSPAVLTDGARVTDP